MAKKRVNKSKLAKDKNKFSFKLKLSHIIYLLVLAVFLTNLTVDFVKADRNWYEFGDGTFCGDCCQDCDEDCDCVEEVDDDADDDEDNSSNTTVTAAPSTPNCSEIQDVVSSLSAEVFTYTFQNVVCDSASVDIYLKGSIPINGSAVGQTVTSYIYENRYLTEWGSMSGSGEKARSDGYDQVCIKVGSDETCSNI